MSLDKIEPLQGKFDKAGVASCGGTNHKPVSKKKRDALALALIEMVRVAYDIEHLRDAASCIDSGKDLLADALEGGRNQYSADVMDIKKRLDKCAPDLASEVSGLIYGVKMADKDASVVRRKNDLETHIQAEMHDLWKRDSALIEHVVDTAIVPVHLETSLCMKRFDNSVQDILDRDFQHLGRAKQGIFALVHDELAQFRDVPQGRGRKSTVTVGESKPH